MFKFDFDLEIDDTDEDLVSHLALIPFQSDSSQSAMVSNGSEGPKSSQFIEHTLESLVSGAPAIFFCPDYAQDLIQNLRSKLYRA